MHLVVISHKLCWPSLASPSGYATDGGFPVQMEAISELFSSTTLVMPCAGRESDGGVKSLVGNNLSVKPLAAFSGHFGRKFSLLWWLIRSSPSIIREIGRADAVHVPIPSNIGTIGMLFGFCLRKPLLIRHCGNWFVQRTSAERFWKWFMERFAGGRNVMLATGGHADPPSPRNPNVNWIFSTSLRERDLKALECSLEKDSQEHVRLIIACRQEVDKGTGRVIESLPLILNDFPQATLDVIGDGSALPAFKELAAGLNVSDRVTFHGKVDQPSVVNLLRQADLFCYPTAASEGFPKVVLEALACGLPVITTRVSVLPQLIGNGCGVLLEENTGAAMARAVCEVLSDRELYSRMSAQARETARHYSLERWRDQIGETLRLAWGNL